MKRLGLLIGVLVGGLLLTGCQSHSNDSSSATKAKYEKTYGSEQKAYSKFQESTKNGAGDDSEQESESQSVSSSEKYYKDPNGVIMENGEPVLQDKEFAFRIIQLTDSYTKYHNELKREKVEGASGGGFSYTFRDKKDDASWLFNVAPNGQTQVFRGDEIVEQKDWMKWLR